MMDYCYTAIGVSPRQKDWGIHWQIRSETFTWKAYPACFEQMYEARGILRAARNHVIFPDTT